MPISPQIIAEKRIENTVTKLCDLIDKKLQESEETPFVFKFLPNTSPEVINSIVEIYRNVGWSASQAQGSLTLRSPHDEKEEPKKESKNTIKEVTQTKLETREHLIETALASDTGRFALAQSMKEPINTSLMYQSVARKFLMVDDLPLSVSPRYTYGEFDEPLYYASDNKVKPYNHECLDDYVEFMSSVDIDREDIEQRRFYTLDRAQVRLKDSLQNQEVRAIVTLLQASIKEEQIIHTYGETIDRAILDSVGDIETKDMIAAKMLVHPRTYRRFHYTPRIEDNLNEASQRDILMTGLYGHVFTMDIHISTIVPENEVFILPPGNFVGALALPNNHLEVLPCTNEDGGLSYLAKLKCFPVILNPKLVRKIKVRW